MNVSFWTSTSSNIPSASSYTGALLFLTDTMTILRSNGSTWDAYGNGGSSSISFKTTTGDPAGAGESGTLYINTVDKTVKIYEDNAYVPLAIDSVRIAAQASHNVVPTESAVRTAIDSITVDVSSGTSSANEGKAPRLGNDGRLPSYVIPNYALSEFKGTKTSKSGANGITSITDAEVGDFAVVSEGSAAGTYILTADDPSVAGNWVKIAVYNYELPMAGSGSEGVLGGVKVDGQSITINTSTGVISTVSAAPEWNVVPAQSNP